MLIETLREMITFVLRNVPLSHMHTCTLLQYGFCNLNTASLMVQKRMLFSQFVC